jgi:hypothetical protein
MHLPFSNISRRQFVKTTGFGLGAAALASLLGSEKAQASPNASDGIGPSMDLDAFRTVAPKAKRVIFLCMAGGPSHLETFDYKPELARLTGKPMPESFTKGQPLAQLQGKELKCMGPIIPFRRHGKSGQMISDYLPHTAKIADDIAIIRSMVTEQINHDPAHTFMNTGTAISGRPSMGSWVNYGLGSENQNLPGFVVMTSVGGRNPQPISSRQWDCGFLPGKYQGVEFSATGAAVNYLENPAGMSEKQQREAIDTINRLNQHRNEKVFNPDIDTRISAYELAFRMQTSVPELLDVSDESPAMLQMYGAVPGDGSFASNCLLARRLVERDVRFVHLYHRGWDHHGGLEKFMPICCDLTDKPAAALVMDLKQRGLLDETLVIWGGEFGRTPMIQEKGGAGRDHHIKGFSMWMAGGGVKGGVTHGATDELGYHAVQDVVHVRDLHATMLHLLGIDATQFMVKQQGLDMKLTGVEEPKVVHNIIA